MNLQACVFAGVWLLCVEGSTLPELSCKGDVVLQHKTTAKTGHWEEESRSDDGKELVGGSEVGNSRAHTHSFLATWRQAHQADPGLFVGCSQIFLDVGSNRGTHVRKLFEPHKYPRAPYMKYFNDMFGTPEHRARTSAETGICAFGWEANPRWAPTLKHIEAVYAKRGWRAKWFVPEAVRETSGSTSFWLNDANGTWSDWGASIKKTRHFAREITVPGTDLSNFMEQLNKETLPGSRLMKIDIEAAEFVVLPPFLSKQLLCKFVLDVLTIEWHEQFLKTQKELSHASRIRQQVESPRKCNSGLSTRVDTFDDESYLNDGKPLDT